MTIGKGTRQGLVDYRVDFALPPGETHTEGVFEAPTGYMPPTFRHFWRYDRTSRGLVPLSDGPGEQPDPVAFATDDGKHAMGSSATTPDRTPTGASGSRTSASSSGTASFASETRSPGRPSPTG